MSAFVFISNNGINTIIIVVVIAVAFFINKIIKNGINQKKSEEIGGRLIANQPSVLESINNAEPQFSQVEFTEWCKRTFYTMLQLINIDDKIQLKEFTTVDFFLKPLRLGIRDLYNFYSGCEKPPIEILNLYFESFNVIEEEKIISVIIEGKITDQGSYTKALSSRIDIDYLMDLQDYDHDEEKQIYLPDFNVFWRIKIRKSAVYKSEMLGYIRAFDKCPNCGAKVDDKSLGNCPYCNTPYPYEGSKQEAKWLIASFDVIS